MPGRSVALTVAVAAVPDGGNDYESWFTAEIPVHNPITSHRILLDRESAGYSWLNGTGEYFRDIADLHDFRLTTYPPGPEWALDSVIYQVFRVPSSVGARRDVTFGGGRVEVVHAQARVRQPV